MRIINSDKSSKILGPKPGSNEASSSDDKKSTSLSNDNAAGFAELRTKLMSSIRDAGETQNQINS